MANRITDADLIEHRLLELAYTTDVKITAQVLAYFAPCSIDAASKVLDDLTARDQLAMEIEDSGMVVYHVPDRRKLELPHATPTAARDAAVAPRAPQHHVSPVLAAILSMFVPGAGHLYAGRVVSALAWFFVVSVGYVLILPGLLFHVLNIIAAAGTARHVNATNPRGLLAA